MTSPNSCVLEKKLLESRLLASMVLFIPTCLLQVHLCEAEGLPEFLGEGSPLPDRDGHSVLVAVKQLRADATSQARYAACPCDSVFMYIDLCPSLFL